MTLDTPSAVAASICFLARTSHVNLRFAEGRHPTTCAWCVYERSDLIRMVDEFNTADMEGRASATFRRLNPNAQRTLVDAALYEAEPVA